jgi:hypothetical protein
MTRTLAAAVLIRTAAAARRQFAGRTPDNRWPQPTD